MMHDSYAKRCKSNRPICTTKNMMTGNRDLLMNRPPSTSTASERSYWNRVKGKLLGLLRCPHCPSEQRKPADDDNCCRSKDREQPRHVQRAVAPIKKERPRSRRMATFLSRLFPSVVPLLLLLLPLTLFPCTTEAAVQSGSVHNPQMPHLRPTFVLNLRMGTVICQHSAETQDLHVHDVSILCDGRQDCFKSEAIHDEMLPFCDSRSLCNSTLCSNKGACLAEKKEDGEIEVGCYCNAGFAGKHCEHAPPFNASDCTLSGESCHWLATCNVAERKCECPPGFAGDGHYCVDVDECEANAKIRCPANSECVNLPGTYMCNCTKGFIPSLDFKEGSETCIDQIEFSKDATVDAFTVNLNAKSTANAGVEDHGNKSALLTDILTKQVGDDSGIDHADYESEMRTIRKKLKKIVHEVREQRVLTGGYVLLRKNASAPWSNGLEITLGGQPSGMDNRTRNESTGGEAIKVDFEPMSCDPLKANSGWGCPAQSSCEGGFCQCIEGFGWDPMGRKCEEEVPLAGVIDTLDAHQRLRDQESLGDHEFPMPSADILARHEIPEGDRSEEVSEAPNSDGSSADGTHSTSDLQMVRISQNPTPTFPILSPHSLSRDKNKSVAKEEQWAIPSVSEVVLVFNFNRSEYSSSTTTTPHSAIEEVEEQEESSTSSLATTTVPELLQWIIYPSDLPLPHINSSAMRTVDEVISGLQWPPKHEDDTSPRGTGVVDDGKAPNELGLEITGRGDASPPGTSAVDGGKVPNELGLEITGGGDATLPSTSNVPPAEGVPINPPLQDGWGLEISPNDANASPSPATEPRAKGKAQGNKVFDETELSPSSVGGGGDRKSPSVPDHSPVGKGAGNGMPRVYSLTPYVASTIAMNKAGDRSKGESDGINGATSNKKSASTSSQGGKAEGTEMGTVSSATSPPPGPGSEKEEQGLEIVWSESSSTLTTPSRGSRTTAEQGLEIGPDIIVDTEAPPSLRTTDSINKGGANGNGVIVDEAELPPSSVEGAGERKSISGPDPSPKTKSTTTPHTTKADITAEHKHSEGRTPGSLHATSPRPSHRTDTRSTPTGHHSSSASSNAIPDNSPHIPTGHEGSTLPSQTTTKASRKTTTAHRHSSSSTAPHQRVTSTTHDQTTARHPTTTAGRPITTTHRPTTATHGPTTPIHPTTTQTTKDDTRHHPTATRHLVTTKHQTTTRSSTTAEHIRASGKTSQTTRSHKHISATVSTTTAKAKTTGDINSSTMSTFLPEKSEHETSTHPDAPAHRSTIHSSQTTTIGHHEIAASEKITDKSVASTPAAIASMTELATTVTTANDGLEKHACLNSDECGKDAMQIIGASGKTSQKTADHEHTGTTSPTTAEDKTNPKDHINPSTMGTLHPENENEMSTKTQPSTHTVHRNIPHASQTTTKGQKIVTREQTTVEPAPSSTPTPNAPTAELTTTMITPTTMSSVHPGQSEHDMSTNARHPATTANSSPTDASQTTTIGQGIATSEQTAVEPATPSTPAPVAPAATEPTATDLATAMTTTLVGLEEHGCLSSDECGKDAFCERATGRCQCNTGFWGSPKTSPCIDINECQARADDCHSSSICVNYIGGFDCHCPVGYRLSPLGVCEDINECLEQNGTLCDPVRAACVNLPGAYHCQCQPGYSGKVGSLWCDGYNCLPINGKKTCSMEEWVRSDCGRNHLCLVDGGNGGPDCSQCKQGFRIQSGVCSDIDECAEPSTSSERHRCHPNARCLNLVGGYSCECSVGYEGSGFHCVDIDECSANANERGQSPCHPQALCTNSIGSYACKCPEGWGGDGWRECWNPADHRCATERLQIESCRPSSSSSACLSVERAIAGAKDGPTSLCECPRNFRHNPATMQCEDIDECHEGRHNCDTKTAQCVNNVGGYFCICLPGFDGTNGVCTDVDECARGIASCRPNAECINTVGGFTCRCPPGTVDNGRYCIAEELNKPSVNACSGKWVSMCKTINKTCHLDEEEVPRCGSCLPGHQPMDGECRALAEMGGCQDPSRGNCHPDAQCIDTTSIDKENGMHHCICRKGFIGDGARCDDIDECSMPHICDPNATCKNLQGGYKCRCNKGYQGNGEACVQVIVALPSTKTATTTTHSRMTATHSGPTTVSTPNDSTSTSISTQPRNDPTTHSTSGSRSSSTPHHTTTTAGRISTTIQRRKTTKSSSSSPAGHTSTIRPTPSPTSTHRHTTTNRHLTVSPSISTNASSMTTTTTQHRRSTSQPRSISQRAHPTNTPHSSSSTSTSKRYRTSTHPTPTHIPHRGSTTTRAITRPSTTERSTTTSLRHSTRDNNESNQTIAPLLLRKCPPALEASCDRNAQCLAAAGVCQCLPGFIGDGRTCEPDRWDCEARGEESLCSEHAACVGRRCRCHAGYTGDGTTCISMKTHPGAEGCQACHCKANCVRGSCQCGTGYFGNGVLCVPDPEDCLIYPALCAQTASKCNTARRRCECPNGRPLIDSSTRCAMAEGESSPQARPVSMPIIGSPCPSTCPPNSECNNGACRCLGGYILDKDGQCTDIDECKMAEATCGANTLCRNLAGAYSCRCMEGYIGDGPKECHPYREIGYRGDYVECLPDAIRLHMRSSFQGTVAVRGQATNSHCSGTFPNSGVSYFNIPINLCDVEIDANNSIATTVVFRSPSPAHSFAYRLKCVVPPRTNYRASSTQSALPTSTSYLTGSTQSALSTPAPLPTGVTTNAGDIKDQKGREPLPSYPAPAPHRTSSRQSPLPISTPNRAVSMQSALSTPAPLRTGVETSARHTNDQNDRGPPPSYPAPAPYRIGPPPLPYSAPTCSLLVSNEGANSIRRAELGQVLKLTLRIEPSQHFIIHPRNCYAINMGTGQKHLLTDAAGCSVNADLFPAWRKIRSNVAEAYFHTFKWPNCYMVRFECDCSGCVGDRCPKMDCSRPQSIRAGYSNGRWKRTPHGNESFIGVGLLGHSSSAVHPVVFSPLVPLQGSDPSERHAEQWLIEGTRFGQQGIAAERDLQLPATWSLKTFVNIALIACCAVVVILLIVIFIRKYRHGARRKPSHDLLNCSSAADIRRAEKNSISYSYLNFT